ncbi:flavin reductase family protein [Chryseobacterium sp. KACC 21268]|nr:flavin reductase family protein [Chryseobacterium sp. KACC 21268]
MKTIIPSGISAVQLQQVMQTAIAPRPIALASTINAKGEINLSPFSFFNMFSTVPPVVIISPSRRVRDNTTKHTLENLKEVPELVIGNVNFEMVQQVSLASTEYEDGINEFIKSGLTMKPSDIVKPPLIAESPVNFECKVLEIKSLGKLGGAGNLVIAEIVKIHINEKYLDKAGNLNQKQLDLVARLGGNFYSRNNESNIFEVPKPLVTKGIGYDQLPDEIKQSHIFTGNDLGMLANVEILSTGRFSSEKDVHLLAQNYLKNNEIENAWNVLKSE